MAELLFEPKVREGILAPAKGILAPAMAAAMAADGARLRVPVPSTPPAPLTGGDVLVRGRIHRWCDRWCENPFSHQPIPLIAVGESGLELAYPWAAWQSHVLTEAYAVWRRRPWYTRSPVSYRVVPGRLRHLVAGRMCRLRADDDGAFPQAPFDGGFEALRAVVRRYETSAPGARRDSRTSDSTPGARRDSRTSDSTRTSDPAASPAPRICLTHDVDTAAGFRFVREIANVEAGLGLRSCWNVVPFGDPVDHGVCDWLIERGFEIGLHGHCHDNRLIYLANVALRRRLDACRGFIERYGVRGFRSPSWLRDMRLMRVLADYVDYDCSCLDFDWLCPAGRGGVLTATPFRFGTLVEIPTTLPFEAPAMIRDDAEGAVAYWRPKIEWLRHVRGQAVVNTHPDPHYSGNAPMIRAYGRFLEELLDAFGGAWSLPRRLSEEVSDVE